MNEGEAGNECGRRVSVQGCRVSPLVPSLHLRPCRSSALAFFAGPLCSEEPPRHTARGPAPSNPKSKSLPAGSPSMIAERHGHYRITRP
jgi:hypothetical protein